MTLSEKVQLVCDLAEDGRLSNAHYRCAVVAILYFHNTTSGECFPSLTQIAKAAHVGKATASEAMEVLRSIGVIAFVSSTGGRCKRNTYTLLNVRPTERLAEGKRSPHRTDRSPHRTSRGSPHRTASIQRINPGKKNREAAPATLKRVAASPKKGNGQQQKTGEEPEMKPSQAERDRKVAKWEQRRDQLKSQNLTPEGRAMLKAAGVPIDRFKPLPYERQKWSATEAEREAFARQERGEDVCAVLVAPVVGGGSSFGTAKVGNGS